uniref:Dr1-associated corepressor n=1 Tax=Lynceus sp. MCZ IZ 141354 TaxID=1930659 RepID=A0A9N6WTA6_9CRUS|nr:EOG090X0H1B [Lynceus sp. MCZ IZ 141354]
MPSKKKKYNARFPPARIKKIMQSDEEIGKVAAAVPVIISRALELFVEGLLRKSLEITVSRNAKTLSPAHLKQCILSEARFDFLKEHVLSVPDVHEGEEGGPSQAVPIAPTSQPIIRAPRPPKGTRPRGRPRKYPKVEEVKDEEEEESEDDDESSSEGETISNSPP